MPAGLAELLYLVASALFVVGLKWLGSPDTARNGNRLSCFCQKSETDRTC